MGNARQELIENFFQEFSGASFECSSVSVSTIKTIGIPISIDYSKLSNYIFIHKGYITKEETPSDSDVRSVNYMIDVYKRAIEINEFDNWCTTNDELRAEVYKLKKEHKELRDSYFRMNYS